MMYTGYFILYHLASGSDNTDDNRQMKKIKKCSKRKQHRQHNIMKLPEPFDY